MVQAQVHEISRPKITPQPSRWVRWALFAICLVSTVCAVSCEAIPHGRPPVSSMGGPIRVVSVPWEGLPDRLPEIVAPLHLRVFIVERPAPGWVRVELLDLRDRPLGLRLHRLGKGDDGGDLVEVRCSAGRLGDHDLELEVLDAIAASGG